MPEGHNAEAAGLGVRGRGLGKNARRKPDCKGGCGLRLARLILVTHS